MKKEKVLNKTERRERDASMTVANIKLNLISDNPYQPRKSYQKKGLKLLAKSISERGLLHPISVVKVKDKYVIVGGHRRARAFRILHRETIPAIIRKQSTQKDLALDLAIENALRKDFSPVEKAESIFTVLKTIKNVEDDVLRAYCLVSQVKLMNKRGIEKVTNKRGNSIGFQNSDIFQCQRLLYLLGTSENTACKYLRLLGLPKKIQDRIVAIHSNEGLNKRMISEGYITVSMAYEISRIKGDKERIALYEKAVKGKWNYLMIRKIVDELIETGKSKQINDLGSSKRRGKEDYGIEHITNRCFSLGSSLWNFRKKLVVIPLCMDRIIWRASLKKLKQSCLTLAENIEDLLKDEKGIFEVINLQDKFEIRIKKSTRDGDFRFTFPKKKAKKLSLDKGDKLVVRIEQIKRVVED